MIKIYDEQLGFEPTLPTEIVDFLTMHKEMSERVNENSEAIEPRVMLDEHELAMAA